MNSILRVLSLSCLCLLLAGCRTTSGAAASPTANASDASVSNINSAQIFVLHTTGKDTFLLNTQTGKVWRWNSKEETFLEVPIATKITKFEYGPDGKMREKKPDPKDPLGLFEEQKEARTPKR